MTVPGAGLAAGLEVVDVVAQPSMPARRAALDHLAEVHLRYFPDHAHVVGEIEEVIVADEASPAVVIHAWVLMLDGAPVGEYIFHTHLERGIVLMHFVALDRQARESLPDDWLARLTVALRRTAEADAVERGMPLLAMMGEIPPDHAARWSGLGFRILTELDYREPHHGRHWADFGEPTFFPMVPIVMKVADGLDRPAAEVVPIGVEAFLVGHYRLPPEHPTVVHVLEQARQLSD